MEMENEGKAISIIRIVLALVFPAFLCFVYCLIRGVSLADLYVPASYNNDCVFYYKLVDAVVEYGGPTGYFGFNESRAIMGGFAAWSPLIVLPWSVWGWAFGWSYSSALICNVVLFSVALAIFAYLSETGIKELCFLFAGLFLFPSFSIHLMNILPEIVLTSFVLIYLGFAIRSAIRGAKNSYILAMFTFSAFLTIIRPYMILFMIIPTYYLGKKRSKLSAFVAVVILGVLSAAANLFINHFYTSAYFDPLFKTDIIKLFFQGHFTEAYYTAASVFKNMVAGMTDAFKGAFSYGLTMGTQYVVAVITAIFAVVLSFEKENGELRPIYLTFAFSVLSVILAVIFLLQKTNEGGRHIFVFAIIGIVLVCTAGSDKLGVILKSLTAVLLVVFCVRGAMVPTDYDIPVKDAETAENVEYWKNIFETEGTFDSESEGYSNTVIWTFVDYDENGAGVVTPYSELYELPAGVGISCCYPDYVINSFDRLKSRYVITDSRGRVADMFKENGAEVLGEHGNAVMFKRY